VLCALLPLRRHRHLPKRIPPDVPLLCVPPPGESRFIQDRSRRQLGRGRCVGGMDPAGLFAATIMFDKPKADGSSCDEMAASLRALLRLNFDQVCGAHMNNTRPMPADEFRECIDAAWRWLDGKPLLEASTRSAAASAGARPRASSSSSAASASASKRPSLRSSLSTSFPVMS